MMMRPVIVGLIVFWAGLAIGYFFGPLWIGITTFAAVAIILVTWAKMLNDDMAKQMERDYRLRGRIRGLEKKLERQKKV